MSTLYGLTNEYLKLTKNGTSYSVPTKDTFLSSNAVCLDLSDKEGYTSSIGEVVLNPTDSRQWVSFFNLVKETANNNKAMFGTTKQFFIIMPISYLQNAGNCITEKAAVVKLNKFYSSSSTSSSLYFDVEFFASSEITGKITKFRLDIDDRIRYDIKNNSLSKSRFEFAALESANGGGNVNVELYYAANIGYLLSHSDYSCDISINDGIGGGSHLYRNIKLNPVYYYIGSKTIFSFIGSLYDVENDCVKTIIITSGSEGVEYNSVTFTLQLKIIDSCEASLIE